MRFLKVLIGSYYTVSVDFSDDGPEHPIVDTVSHDDENRSHHGGRNATLLVVIEAVEHLPQHFKQIFNIMIFFFYFVIYIF